MTEDTIARINGTAGPLFLPCPRRTALVCWAGIIGTVSLIMMLLTWLAFEASAQINLVKWIVPSVVVGLFVSDVGSGFLHWLFDTCFDDSPWFPRAVGIAAEHHAHPNLILAYGFRDYAGFSSIPALLAVTPLATALALSDVPRVPKFAGLILCATVLTCFLFAGYGHALGHRWGRTRGIRALQRMHILLSPRHHRKHHAGRHDTYYCALFGWTNYLCDNLRIWRALELVTTFITGRNVGPRSYPAE